jgi:hypothetical protein
MIPMTQPNPDLTKPAVTVTPLRCLTGALMAGCLGLLLYRLTQAIATSFAAHPLISTQPLAHNLSAAVRTLVVGMATLATGIFSLAALGLVGLAIQLLIQRFTGSAASPSQSDK